MKHGYNDTPGFAEFVTQRHQVKYPFFFSVIDDDLKYYQVYLNNIRLNSSDCHVEVNSELPHHLVLFKKPQPGLKLTIKRDLKRTRDVYYQNIISAKELNKDQWYQDDLINDLNSELDDKIKADDPRLLDYIKKDGSVLIDDYRPTLPQHIVHRKYINELYAHIPEGPPGEQGPRGDRGPTGVQGHIGLQGHNGEQGDQGETGHVGSTGNPGRRGDPGIGFHIQGTENINDIMQNQKEEIWVVHSTDPAYPDYNVHDAVIFYEGIPINLGPLQGLTGAKGINGPEGPVGEDGPIGDRGDRGNQGIKGPEGDKGPEGPEGDQGPQGIQGETGPEGPPADDELIDYPKGIIIMWYINTIPAGWAECNGLNGTPNMTNRYVYTDPGATTANKFFGSNNKSIPIHNHTATSSSSSTSTFTETVRHGSHSHSITASPSASYFYENELVSGDRTFNRYTTLTMYIEAWLNGSSSAVSVGTPTANVSTTTTTTTTIAATGESATDKNMPPAVVVKYIQKL